MADDMQNQGLNMQDDEADIDAGTMGQDRTSMGQQDDPMDEDMEQGI